MVTPEVRKLYNQIVDKYPKMAEREALSPQFIANECAMYNAEHDKDINNIPTMKELLDYIETLRNAEGKSLLYAKDEYVIKDSPEHKEMISRREARARHQQISQARQDLRNGNIGQALVRLMGVYHGSTVRFNKFDHSSDPALNALLDEFRKAGIEFTRDNEWARQVMAMADRLMAEPELLSSEVDNAIKTGKWSKQALNKVENLVNKIENGEIIFKRRAQETGSSNEKVNGIYAAASLLLRGHEKSASQKYRDSKEKFNSESKEGREQERIIEAWAKAADLWLNDYTDENGNKAKSLEDLLESQWDYIDQGSEAEVRRFDDNTIIKSINMSHYNDNVTRLIDKIGIHNQLFPETALSIVGFGRDSLGHFRVIVTQPYVKGQQLTDAEFDDFIKKHNLKLVNGVATSMDGSVSITDLAPYNIIKDINGEYQVIDADYRYNTVSEGGNIVLDSTINNNQTAEQENKGIKYLRTTDGTVYGFTYMGKIYLDPELADSGTAIHEYTHLWAEMIRMENPEFWQEIKETMKSLPVWQEILDNPMYKKLRGNEDAIADEVLATYSGRQGKKRIDEMMQRIDREMPNMSEQEVAKAAINRLRDVLNRFWQAVGEMLGIKGHTPTQIADMVLRDLFNGINPTVSLQTGDRIRMQATSGFT